MHFALSEAASGRHSAFVCRREKIEKDLPVLPDGMDPHHDLLKAVHMKCASLFSCASGTISSLCCFRYVSNVKDLMSFAIDGRFLMDRVDSIVVDDLALLLAPERRISFAISDMSPNGTLFAGRRDLRTETTCSECSPPSMNCAKPSGTSFLVSRICRSLGK